MTILLLLKDLRGLDDTTDEDSCCLKFTSSEFFQVDGCSFSVQSISFAVIYDIDMMVSIRLKFHVCTVLSQILVPSSYVLRSSPYEPGLVETMGQN